MSVDRYVAEKYFFTSKNNSCIQDDPKTVDKLVGQKAYEKLRQKVLLNVDVLSLDTERYSFLYRVNFEGCATQQ